MQVEQHPPYLFFSPKCPHCTQLIKTIQQDKKVADFIIPVDIHKHKQNLPKGLTEVPAILFNDNLTYGVEIYKLVKMFSDRFNSKSKEEENGRNQGNGNTQVQVQVQDDNGGIVPMDSSDMQYDTFSTQDNPIILSKSYNPSNFYGFNENNSGNGLNLDLKSVQFANDVTMSSRPNKSGELVSDYERLKSNRDQTNNQKNDTNMYAHTQGYQ